MSRGSRSRISVSPVCVFAIAPLLRMSVSGRGELLEDRTGEIVPAPGREDDFDPGIDRACDRSPIGRRDLAVAVENRAVDVEGKEPNRQTEPSLLICDPRN